MIRKYAVRRVVIFIFVLHVIIAAAIFIYRYQIFQFSAEKFIRGALPPYAKIDSIKFELRNSRVVIKGFRISNPPGFSSNDLLYVGQLVCKYKMRGANIMSGIEILEPQFEDAVLSIERLRDAKLNILEMKPYIDSLPKAPANDEKSKSDAAPDKAGSVRLADAVKLPETFSLKSGTFIFTDYVPYERPYVVTLQNITASLSLKFNSDYSGLLKLATTGEGDFNGKAGSTVKWNVVLDPTTPKLSMSNRLEVSNIEIRALEPYYDSYSPFVFNTGNISGTLIFDFDNGNIGATNEVHISKFQFYIKKGHENAQLWQTSVQDLAKYFTSSFNDIVFDFKIKGDIANPEFFLGPISRQAVMSMTIDKATGIIQALAGSSSSPSGGTTAEADKAKQYIDLIKGFMKKE